MHFGKDPRSPHMPQRTLRTVLLLQYRIDLLTTGCSVRCIAGR